MRPSAGKYTLVYRLHKMIGLVATALLIVFAVTEMTRLTSFASHVVANDGAAGVSLMGRGGQFDKPPLW